MILSWKRVLSAVETLKPSVDSTLEERIMLLKDYITQFTSAFTIMLLTTACAVEAQQRNTTPYSEATYSIPSDPAKVVLHIGLGGGMRKRNSNSATLYADGRLEISALGKGDFQKILTHEELQQVLQMAIGYGLAEWHSSTIHAQQLKKYEGRQIPMPSDATRAIVLLAVDDYRRGDYEIESVEKTIRVKAPTIARRLFPEIPQYEGITQLVGWLQEQVAMGEDGAK